MADRRVIIIGGGILGLATAHRLLERHAGCRVTVLEKEAELGRHQTGHNSGVLHSGVYYAPGSLKARTCAAGKRAMEALCAAHGIPFDTCGKVIVATGPNEVPRLERLHERATANGVACRLIGPDELREREPFAAGVQALLVPGTGIVDFRRVCTVLAELVERDGGVITTGVRGQSIRPASRGVLVETAVGTFEGDLLVNCAGLYADRIAAAAGATPPARIVPFRGEYYALRPYARPLCRHLIYPVPDPAFPFLGVHFTRTIGGGVECGPNAVLALAREGYRKRDVNARDFMETLAYRGLRRLARAHWRIGARELWRSWSRRAFVQALQRLVPALRDEDLEPAPAGVRAQAVLPDGALADDFLLVESERAVHVCNAPSPAATAALAIADAIVDTIETRWPAPVPGSL